MSPLDHALGEGITVFQVAILLVPASLLAGVPWRDSRPGADTAAAAAGAAGTQTYAAPAEPVLQPAAGLALEGADR